MDKYLYLIKIRLLSTLQYRLEAAGGLMSNIIPLLTMVYVWKSGFKAAQIVGGVSQMQMVTYSILALGLKDVFFFNVQDSLFNGIRSGGIAIDLSRPYHLLGRYFAEDLALSVSAFIRRFLPLVIFSSLFIQLPAPASVLGGALAFVSIFASFGILWCLSALMGLTSFWTIDIGNLGMVKDALVRILSGSIVPIWFFSDTVQQISLYLPFQYTYQTPLAIYIGKISPLDSIASLGCQLLWLGIFTITIFWIWALLKKEVVVQGG